MSNSNPVPKQSMQGTWSSKWSFILVTTGAAVGLGNIWKFPYIAGENGGGSFVLIYLICIIVIGVPLVIAELSLGSLSKRNPIGAFRELAIASKKSAKWRFVGGLCVLSGAIILSYYSLIAGWALHYTLTSASGDLLNISSEQADTLFNQFLSNPIGLVFWHAMILFITIGVVMHGIQKGIERTVRYLFPAMLVILMILVLFAAVTSGHFMQAVNYLFKPDFSVITGKTILVAIGHSFFTLSIAVGTLMAYGAYASDDISIPKASCFIAAGDTIIALLMGLAIFPIVFANGLQTDAGPGLIFLTLPIAFGNMPFGSIFATLFFIMIVFAALATTIAFLEPVVSWLTEAYQWNRKRATLFAGITIWLLGLLPVFSFNLLSNQIFFDMNIFDLFDYVTSNIMLPIGGFLIAIFTGWILNKKLLISGIGLAQHRLLFYTLQFILRVIVPIGIIFVFLDVIGIIEIFSH